MQKVPLYVLPHTCAIITGDTYVQVYMHWVQARKLGNFLIGVCHREKKTNVPYTHTLYLKYTYTYYSGVLLSENGRVHVC